LENLSFNTTEGELRSHFEQFGSVTDTYVAMDKMTGRPAVSRSFTMGTPDEAKMAIEKTNGVELLRSALQVNEARPKEERPGGGFGGGGGRGGFGGGGGRGGYGGGRGGRSGGAVATAAVVAAVATNPRSHQRTKLSRRSLCGSPFSFPVSIRSRAPSIAAHDSLRCGRQNPPGRLSACALCPQMQKPVVVAAGREPYPACRQAGRKEPNSVGPLRGPRQDALKWFI